MSKTCNLPIQPFQTLLGCPRSWSEVGERLLKDRSRAGPHIWVGIFRAGNGKINKILCCLAGESAASHGRQCCSCFSTGRSPSPSSSAPAYTPSHSWLYNMAMLQKCRDVFWSFSLVDTNNDDLLCPAVPPTILYSSVTFLPRKFGLSELL